jgi:hypothetical protein
LFAEFENYKETYYTKKRIELFKTANKVLMLDVANYIPVVLTER